MLPYSTKPSGSFFLHPSAPGLSTAYYTKPTQRQQFTSTTKLPLNTASGPYETHQQFRRYPQSSSTTAATAYSHQPKLDSHYPQQVTNPPQSHYIKQKALTEMQQRRMDALQSMRKHRSLDGSLFLSELEAQQPFQSNVPPPSNVYNNEYMDQSYGIPPPTQNPYSARYGVGPNPYSAQPGLSSTNYPLGYDDLSATLGPPNSSKMPPFVGPDSIETLRRENAALNQKLNYMMNSIKTFWSPELKNERQQRKNESVRLANFQDKIMQQAAEIQQIRNELERREKDIGQLLSDSDLIDMEDELRRLRQQLANEQLSNGMPSSSIQKPRDYTDKTTSSSELYTLKMKMERSEMALAEKQRELQNAELRLKGAEEQNAELEKRLEIISRSGVANEAQLKLVNDDVNMLRSKLETRNQLIESKEKSIKHLEKDIEMLRQQLIESGQGIHTQDHRNTQLQIRLDQLETLLREREVELATAKQRLLQQPSTRIEQELQQRIESLENENKKLMETIDSVRTNAELEKQQQLKAFQEETRNLTATIERLQKELQDRQVLLTSQNEKILQFDSQFSGLADQATTTNVQTTSRGMGTQSSATSASNTLEKTAKKIEHLSSEMLQKELEEARNEVGHLLQRIQTLEKDKISLQNKFNSSSYDQTTTGSLAYSDSKAADLASARKTECSALKLRIEELEEALRESVGITAEREKQLNEQKTIIQQLSVQISDLYKDPTRRLKGTGKTDAEQKAWDDERARYQRQLCNLRKEVTMAAIREKDLCIQLLQGPPDPIKEKIEILLRQKEQLKHRLLTQNNEMYSTGEERAYLANVWLAAQNPEPTTGFPFQQQTPFTTAQSKLGSQQHRVQPSYSNYVQSGGSNGIIPGAPTSSQISVSIPYGTTTQGPASFTFGTKIDASDQGIWA